MTDLDYLAERVPSVARLIDGIDCGLAPWLDVYPDGSELAEVFLAVQEYVKGLEQELKASRWMLETLFTDYVDTGDWGQLDLTKADLMERTLAALESRWTRREE